MKPNAMFYMYWNGWRVLDCIGLPDDIAIAVCDGYSWTIKHGYAEYREEWLLQLGRLVAELALRHPDSRETVCDERYIILSPAAWESLREVLA